MKSSSEETLSNLTLLAKSSGRSCRRVRHAFDGITSDPSACRSWRNPAEVSAVTPLSVNHLMIWSSLPSSGRSPTRLSSLRSAVREATAVRISCSVILIVCLSCGFPRGPTPRLPLVVSQRQTRPSATRCTRGLQHPKYRAEKNPGCRSFGDKRGVGTRS